MTSSNTAYPPGVALPLDTEAQTSDNASTQAAIQSTALHNAAAESIPIQVKLLRPEAKAPTRGSKFSAGYDIYVCEDGLVPARGQAMMSTGISIAIPPGTCECQCSS